MHGIVIGYFCPMHYKHMEVIEKANKECTNVSVVVCGYPGDDPVLHLPLELRASLVAQELQHQYKLYHKVPETLSFDLVEQGIKDDRSYDNWKRFATAIIESVHNTDLTFKWYVEDPVYVRPLMALGYEVKDVSGNTRSVQSKMLSDNAVQYIDLVTKFFRKYCYPKYRPYGQE